MLASVNVARFAILAVLGVGAHGCTRDAGDCVERALVNTAAADACARLRVARGLG